MAAPAQLEACLSAWAEAGEMTAFQARTLLALFRSKHHKVLGALDAFPAEAQRAELFQALSAAALDELSKAWNALFADCTLLDAKRISRLERTSLGLDAPSLVYGEVAFHTMGSFLWSPVLALKSGGVFYDLGSGTGRAVFAASMLHDFSRCVGIEVLEGLYMASVEQLARFEKEGKTDAPAERKHQEIVFVRADLLDYDWSDADVVFANSTCFEDSLMRAIARKAAKLRDGAFVVTMTKQLVSPHFRLLHSETHPTSWGSATIHVHQKLSPLQALAPKPPAAPLPPQQPPPPPPPSHPL